MITLRFETVTATTAQLVADDIPGDAIKLVAQISPRLDFAWCVCPQFDLAPTAVNDLEGLNQSQTYYGRVRAVTPAGDQPWSNIVGFITPEAEAPDTAPAAVMIEPAIIMVPQPVIAWHGDALAGFPVANLGRDAPVAWQVDATDNEGLVQSVIVIECAGTPINTVALLNHNLPEDATIAVTVHANLADAQSGDDVVATFEVGGEDTFPARASANLTGRDGYHALGIADAPIAGRFIRVVLTGTTPGLRHYAELLAIGLARVSKNHAVEKKETPLDLGTLERSRSGQPTRIRGFRMRRAEFDLAMLSESQYETLYGDLGRLVGTTDPVLVVPNSKRGAFLHDRILFGNLSGSVTNPSSPWYTRSFTIDSIVG